MSPDRWTKIADIVREEIEVFFFVANMRLSDSIVESITDEPVSWHPVEQLPENCVENVRWLVPYIFDLRQYDHVLSMRVVEKPKIR